MSRPRATLAARRSADYETSRTERISPTSLAGARPLGANVQWIRFRTARTRLARGNWGSSATRAHAHLSIGSGPSGDGGSRSSSGVLDRGDGSSWPGATRRPVLDVANAAREAAQQDWFAGRAPRRSSSDELPRASNPRAAAHTRTGQRAPELVRGRSIVRRQGGVPRSSGQHAARFNRSLETCAGNGRGLADVPVQRRGRRRAERLAPRASRQPRDRRRRPGHRRDDRRRARRADHARVHRLVERRAARWLAADRRLRARAVARQDRRAAGARGSQGRDREPGSARPDRWRSWPPADAYAEDGHPGRHRAPTHELIATTSRPRAGPIRRGSICSRSTWRTGTSWPASSRR